MKTRPGQLRAAIVGAGVMGRWHAHYAAAAGAEIAAVVDPDRAATAALQARHRGAAAFAELEASLAAPAVDLVHVCTPVATHFDLCSLALEGGKHVLVEKPLAETVEQTQRLVRLAAEREVLLNPVHQFPFQRGARRVRERLASLGPLVEVSFVTSSAGGTGKDAEERRALLFEILPHPLSLFRAVQGSGLADVAWRIVVATDDDLDAGGEQNGVLLRIRISLRGRPTRNELTVVGERGTAYADLFHGFSIVETGAPSRRTKIIRPFVHGEKLLGAAGANLIGRAVRSEPAYPGLRELTAAFHAAVREGRQAPIADVEILEVAQVVERLRQARAQDATQ